MSESVEIIRFHAGEYHACFDVMNRAFQTAKPGHPDFRDILPKMCADDDEHMGKHFGIRRDGKICAVLGVYPLPVTVAGVKLMCSTVGNVATLPEESGKGYMSLLLDEAMVELERIGADFSRLGGLRERYNRCGYEKSGTNYSFSMTVRNAGKLADPSVTFRAFGESDTAEIAYAQKLFYRGGIAADRLDDHNFYLSLIAWKNVPWAAYDAEGSMIGYLSVSADGKNIAEVYAESPARFAAILGAWCLQQNAQISFPLQAWQAEETRILSAVCDTFTLGSPCHFFIRHWDKVTDALMKLKASYNAMPEGEMILGIEGWGNLKLYVRGGSAGACRTEEAAPLTLDRLAATRYLFGPLPHVCAGADMPMASAWLPLPLSWNLQDRV